MTWLLLTVACIIMWGVTDILFKVSLDRNDPLSQHKSFVWIGIIMLMAAFVMSTWSTTLANSVKLLMNDALYLFPLALVYATALFFGLLGMKHLDVSIVSPLENIDGALAALIIYFYFLLTGYVHPSHSIEALEVIATVAIIVGVIILGCQEQALQRKEAHLSEDKKKHRFGAVALFFPIIYTLIDVFSVAEISGIDGASDGIVSQAAEASIPAMDFFIFECSGFAVVAIGVWLYMAIFKKYKYNPFQPEEVVRCGAATGETFGTMTFLFAASMNPILTAPLTSSYCIVTIILARIFLKERLNKMQYISLALLLVGIALLGISDVLGV